MIRSTSIALVCALSASQAQPAFAYIKFGVPAGGRTVTLKWSQTPRYFVSTDTVPGVGAADFQGAVARAFATWEAVPTSTIAYQLAGTTSARRRAAMSATTPAAARRRTTASGRSATVQRSARRDRRR